MHTSGEGLSIECRKAFDGMETHIADCYSAIFTNLDIRPNDWIALSAMTSRTNELVQSGNPIPACPANSIDDAIEAWHQVLMYSHWCMVASGYALEQGEIGDAIHLHGVSAKYLGMFNDALNWFNALAENSDPNTGSSIERTAIEMSASVLKQVRTRKDGLSIAMEQGWNEYIGKHGTKPSARALFDLLSENSSSDTGIVIDATDDKLTWRKQDGKFSDTPFKAFQGRFTALKKRM